MACFETDQSSQKNAFELLMDSRHKSIGRNSPGRENSDEPSWSQESVERKIVKAKRTIVLQKMAELKGSLQVKEREERIENDIKRKMAKRVDKLKSILTTTSPNRKNQTIAKSVSKKDHKKIILAEKCLDLTCFSNNSLPESKYLAEDEEFLRKLSPSMKKKENMLSYFKKIGEEEESLIKSDGSNSKKMKGVIVKVKLKETKRKTKNVHSINRLNCDRVCNKEDDEAAECNKKNGTTHNSNEVVNTIDLSCEKDDDNINCRSRFKRNIKRPIKYVYDNVLSSSDEELQTSKSKIKKNCKGSIQSRSDLLKKKQKKISSQSVSERNSKENTLKNNVDSTDFVKLAPIFATKPFEHISKEAKQKFLHSGIPEQLKKFSSKIQNTKNEGEISDFPIVVHIQQRVGSNVEVSENPNFFNDQVIEDDIIDFTCNDTDVYKKLLFFTIFDKSGNACLLPQSNTKTQLKHIKQSYTKFPVYRTYSLLKEKSEGNHIDKINCWTENSLEIINCMTENINQNVLNLNWSDKYKALSTDQIIGNFESVKELKKWLVNWTDNQMSKKNHLQTNSDSSEYYDSDSDSRSSIKTTNSLLVLTGPVGSGKTSCVYAVASELALKVIEVNASSKRTGKIMLQDLQEATQSHKVNRGKGTSGIENSQKSQEYVDFVLPRQKFKSSRKGGQVINRHKKGSDTAAVDKTDSQSSTENVTDMSLILIDDADIVFEQDDGFTSAITQIIRSSKRPVILITTSLSCSHLQRFLQCGKIIHMNPFLPKMLGTWLDIMCLADTGICFPGVGFKLLDIFEGDIRRAINYLQFYTLTESNQNKTKQIDIQHENNIRETLNTSCTDSRGLEQVKYNLQIDEGIENKAFKYVLTHESHISLDVFNIWWSIPKFFYDTSKGTNKGKEIHSSHCILKYNQIETISNVLNNFSSVDCIYDKKVYKKPNITSPPWLLPEGDSVCESEVFEYYNGHLGLTYDISNTLLNNSITKAKSDLGCKCNCAVQYPGMMLKRQKQKNIFHHKKLTEYLNPGTMLNRKSLALDYWSMSRTICRIEKGKTNSNSKRNNRFCHYLKGLSVTSKSDIFDRLCDSLYADENS